MLCSRIDPFIRHFLAAGFYNWLGICNNKLHTKADGEKKTESDFHIAEIIFFSDLLHSQNMYDVGFDSQIKFNYLGVSQF